LPRFSHPSVRLALKPLGPALPAAPLNEVASCPASCIFRLCRRPSFELPRLASFGASSGLKLGSPRSSLLLVTPPDASPRLPRLLHLPALPAMDLRVAPNLSSFSTSGAQAWSFPRGLALPIVPADALPGLPRFLHLPAVPATVLQVAPNCVLRRIWRCCFGFPLGHCSSRCASR